MRFSYGSIILLFIVWGGLPDDVPGHYNGQGEVDRWGSKWELIILPGIGAFILLFTQIFEKFPEVHNYPKRFNKTNAKQFYLFNRKLINQLKNICLVTFAFLLFQDISIAMGWSEGLGLLFLPITIVALSIPIVIAMKRYKKIK